MLFGEPKIPQPARDLADTTTNVGFSALQRAENSSTRRSLCPTVVKREFQCSSASRKFLNRREHRVLRALRVVSVLFSEPKIPQPAAALCRATPRRVSVLFSEPKIPQPGGLADRRTLNEVSVLFSEPKIPQLWSDDPVYRARRVSVLFSEPKIPQLSRRDGKTYRIVSFSALQRAENSSTLRSVYIQANRQCFSALQRAENSSTVSERRRGWRRAGVSVLFSEPKIPQRSDHAAQHQTTSYVSVLFSEPKIPQPAPRTCVHPYFRPR